MRKDLPLKAKITGATGMVIFGLGTLSLMANLPLGAGSGLMVAIGAALLVYSGFDILIGGK